MVIKEECQRRLREKIKICDDLFNSTGSVYYHDTTWHNKFLLEAKTALIIVYHYAKKRNKAIT